MDAKTLVNEFENITCTDIEDYTNLSHQEITKMVLNFSQSASEITVIVPVIFILGVFGNAAFFLLLARVKSMRTITNVYLANLAVADLMTIILETWYQLWHYRRSGLLWNEPFHTSFGCISFTFGYNSFYCASSLLITMVSIDRYIAICHPLKYRYMKLNKQKSYSITVLIWLISLPFGALTIPRFAKLVHVCITWPSDERYNHFPSAVRRCDSLQSFMVTVSGLIHIVPFFVALINTAINNIRIVQRL